MERFSENDLSTSFGIIKGQLSKKADSSDLESLSTTVSNKVDKETGKGLSTNDFTDTLKTKLEGIDMSTKVDKETGKGLSTNDFTDDLKTKLEGIDMSTKVDKETGKGLSTNDFTDTLKTKLEGIDMSTKVDKETGKGLSTNDFTDDLKTKLEGIDMDTKVDKDTSATTGDIATFNVDGGISDSGVLATDIATKTLLSSQVTATNQALSKSEIHELIQRNAASVICGNEQMSAGFQIQSHQFHTLFTTLTCLEDGPWYKIHNGSVVSCGMDSGVYVETNDIATVINDETLFYFYIHNIKYQRVKLGDSSKPWGAITNADGENIDIQVDYTTLGEPVVYIHDTSIKHQSIHNGQTSILLGRVASIPSKTDVIEEYVGCETLADVIGKEPDGKYDLDFPSSVYYCVLSQSETVEKPKWSLSYSINNMSFTNEQFAAINSGATEAKISQIDTNTASIAGKQDTLTTAQLSATNSGITSDLVTQITTNKNNIANKQDTLTTVQLSAVNSGITSDLVTQITTNKNNIANKQDALNSTQLLSVNSGITSDLVTQITTNKNNIANKQDTLTTVQLSAVNSGITSDLVTQITTNKTDIANKQDALTTAQLSAVNSGITSTLVTQIGTNTTAISNKQDKFENVTEESGVLTISEDLSVSNSTVSLTTSSNTINVSAVNINETSKQVSLLLSRAGTSETGETGLNISGWYYQGDSVVDIEAKRLSTSGNTLKVNLKTDTTNDYGSIINISANAGSYGNGAINLTAYSGNSDGSIAITAVSTDGYNQGYINLNGSLCGGFRRLLTTGQTCTPDSYYAYNGAISPSVLKYNDTGYYQSNLSYTFQGKFTASDSTNLVSATTNGVSINWYGDYGIEAGGLYEFNVRKVSSSLCIGIITKLEK